MSGVKTYIVVMDEDSVLVSEREFGKMAKPVSVIPNPKGIDIFNRIIGKDFEGKSFLLGFRSVNETDLCTMVVGVENVFHNPEVIYVEQGSKAYDIYRELFD